MCTNANYWSIIRNKLQVHNQRQVTGAQTGANYRCTHRSRQQLYTNRSISIGKKFSFKYM